MSIEVKISKRPIYYKFAMNFLNKRVEKVKANRGRELLWILEHPTSYTAGIRSKSTEVLDKKLRLSVQIEVEKLLCITLDKKLSILFWI